MQTDAAMDYRMEGLEVRTSEDCINMLMANRKHDETRSVIEREQQRVDLEHFMENASVMEVLGLMAAQYVGQPYRPQFVRAVAACNKVGVSWRVVAKKNMLGGFSRAIDAVELRERVWIAMREDGMSYPEIAYCFGTCHSTIVTAMQRLESRDLTRPHNGA